MMQYVWADLQSARRALLGAPVFTAVAVVTMALGIGATTAVFTVDGAELLRGALVSEPSFGVMGVPLAMGRSFSAAEDQADGPAAIIVSTVSGRPD